MVIIVVLVLTMDNIVFVLMGFGVSHSVINFIEISNKSCSSENSSFGPDCIACRNGAHAGAIFDGTCNGTGDGNGNHPSNPPSTTIPSTTITMKPINVNVSSCTAPTTAIVVSSQTTFTTIIPCNSNPPQNGVNSSFQTNHFGPFTLALCLLLVALLY